MFLKGLQKLGEKPHMWNTKLKIALAQKNESQIEQLLENTPKFDDVEDARIAMHLLREAMILIHTLKDETAESMKQTKKNIDFLNSTEPQKTAKLDIKS